ncbi:CGI121/TPRKB-like protein [Cynara cardunculus var. scolymus]|uniref:CGI121/TPRKB-like protein n=1 Tax=Cynara cardunculus var. scolymus TaxID=59895 RepID=A0A103XM93_CYNCS|nr:CGI121/TPRKB-like protein [Cynara cardunculus var. scolymus]
MVLLECLTPISHPIYSLHFAAYCSLLRLLRTASPANKQPFTSATFLPKVYEISGPTLAVALFTEVSNSKVDHLLLIHISESLKRCGISDVTAYVLAARFGASDEEMIAMKALIKGNEIDLDELEGRANKPQILKHYKITGVELGVSTLGDAITCRIAARDAL